MCSVLTAALILVHPAGYISIGAAQVDPSVSVDEVLSENTMPVSGRDVSENSIISENDPAREYEEETGSVTECESEAETESENRAEPAGAGTVSSGSCGESDDNIIWTITGTEGNYTLSFSGSGKMKDYIGDSGSFAPPWLEEYGSGIKAVTFEGSIESLGSRACMNFTSLEELSFPDSLSSIGHYALEGCTSLNRLHIGKGLSDIGFGAISTLPGLSGITVDPENTVYSDGNGSNVLIRKEGMVLVKGSSSASVPSGVKKIDDYAFDGCSGLTECILPEGVTEIGVSAFGSCTSLTEITLPDSVTVLGDSAFFGCTGLKKITFPDNLTALPAQCLYGCVCLKSVKIPESVSGIGSSAFEGCRSLENVNIPASVSVIPNACFKNCHNLKKIKLPEGVKTIESYAFYVCRALEIIGLPKSLEKIEGSAFEMDGSGTGSKTKSLSGVYYSGSESDWSAVEVEYRNEALTNAGFIYGTPMPDSFAVSSVSLDETEYTLETGGFACLRADAHPLYADDTEFTWTSSDENVAEVDQNGRVTAMAPGTADITAAESGGKKAVCRIRVVESANDNSLSWGLNTDWMFIPRGYPNWPGKHIRSYMFRQGSDYCLVHFEPRYHNGIDWEGIIFARYDAGKRLLYKREIPMELPYWGGFYAADDAYYIVTGQENPEESSEVECFRVTKYDHSWNRLGSTPLFECNTTSPFSFGSLRMAKSGDYIIIRTCHQMYQISDGLRHQSNMTLLYDTKRMEICEDMTEVSSSAMGYVSHSFNQFVEIDSDGVVMLDHGDAYPRSFVINKYYQDISKGSITAAGGSASIDLMEFPGELGENATGAIVNGFAIGKNRYIAAGSSVVQDERNIERTTYNVFVATADKALKASSLHWLTSAAEGERSYHAPQLARISEDRFLILWQRNRTTSLTRDREYIVYYAEVNENGELVSPIYNHKGELSDCVPIVEDGQVQWFTCNDMKVDFYGISTSDISKFTVNGTQSDSDAGEPSGNDNTAEVTGVTLNIHNATLYPGESLKLSAAVSPADSADRSVTFESSDPAVATVDFEGNVKAVSEGSAVITVTTVSGGKKDRMNLRVLPSEVAKEDEDNNSAEREAGKLWVCGLESEYYYTGSAIKPVIRIYKGERRLRESSDYTLTYKNNVKVTPQGASDSRKARLTVRLKGNYTGTKNFYFTILPMPLSKLLPADEYVQFKAGVRNDNIRPRLYYEGKAVKYGDEDLDFGYYQGETKSRCIDKGEYTIRITAAGSGCFIGNTSAKLYVTDMMPVSRVKVTGLKKSYAYTGNPVIPEIELKNGKDTLAEGTDYTVSLENNIEIGRAVMTVSACGDSYIGKRTLKFDIKGKYTLSEDDVSFTYGDGSSYYTCGGAKPEVTVMFGGQRLRKGTDYQVTYRFNKKTGSESSDNPPQAVIKGKGKYKTAGKTGIIKTFTIKPRPLDGLTLVISDRPYSRKKDDYKKTKLLFVNDAFKDQKLKKGASKDYTVTFTVSDGSAVPKTGTSIAVSVNAGSGGNYIGSTGGSFRIINAKQDIGRAEVKINGGKPCPYTGSGIEPGNIDGPGLVLSLKNGDRTIGLEKGTDYEILGYYNNINKGKGVVLLRGKGRYQGVRAAGFTIRGAKWSEI